MTAGAAQLEPPRKVTGPEISALIRSTVIAIDQANMTGNYTVLRDMGAIGFHFDKTAADLADVFRPLRERKIDLGDTVLQDPLMSEQPSLSTDGVLRLKGWFPKEQENVTFDLAFRYEYGRWRILSIAMDIKPIQTKPAAAEKQREKPATP
jgi:hypothetical protein